MQLIMSPLSPFVRKVRVLLREADLLDQVEEVHISTTPMASAPEAIAGNPLGKIPSLVRKDGPAIYDSRVITRYLDTLADHDFYPENRLFEVLTLEATAEGIMDAAVGMTYEMRFRGDKAWDDWLDKQWEKVTRALDAIEERWMSHLDGPLTMAQIATGCALAYLDLRHDARNWRDGRPALAAWEARFSTRPAMQDTVPA